MNANATEGERARSALETISTGLYDKEAQAERDVFSEENMELPHRPRVLLEAYRDGALDAGKPTRTALHFGAQRARQGQVLFDARLGRSISSCTRTKCSSSPVMSSASRRLLPCHRVLHSRSRRCL